MGPQLPRTLGPVVRLVGALGGNERIEQLAHTGPGESDRAVADVHVLDRALGAYYQSKDTGLLESYTRTALRRVWRAQWFSFWMTSMLHRFSDASDFDLRRQIAELDLVTSSPTAAKTLADNYTGLPLG